MPQTLKNDMANYEKQSKNDTYVPKSASLNLNIASRSYTLFCFYFFYRLLLQAILQAFCQVSMVALVWCWRCAIHDLYQFKTSQTSLLLTCGIVCARLFILNIVWCCFMMREPYFNSGGGQGVRKNTSPNPIQSQPFRHGRMYLGMHSPVDIVQPWEVNALYLFLSKERCWR